MTCTCYTQIAFIKQEALEKAREVKVKADEEFNIEKAKIVRQESLAIEAFYQKKLKQIEVNQKIARSHHINKARLDVLDARQQLLNDLLAKVGAQLPSLSANKESYAKLLRDLLLQASFQLMEPKVVVHVRKVDIPIVESVLASVNQEYKAKLEEDVTIYIDKEDFLPEKSAGGLLATSLDGRIKVDNTLENRLHIISEDMLPQIRALLFGKTDRKF